MQIKSDKVIFRNYRKIASKKSGIVSDYIDVMDDKGECTFSSKNVDFSKIELLKIYSMEGKITIRKVGIGVWIDVEELSLRDFTEGRTK
jgi:hypothetical protein